MRLLAFIAAGWIAASLAVALAVGALAGGRYPRPRDPELEDVETDIDAGVGEALGDFYRYEGPLPELEGDRASDAILESREASPTVARGGSGPRPAGMHR